MIADTACFSFPFSFPFPFASPFLFSLYLPFISLYLPFASPPCRGRALLCPPAKDHPPIALYILFYIYRILYITSYIYHHINNTKPPLSAIPKEPFRLYSRPKLASVKRSDRSERPERLLSERSEFQTRQRTKETK